MDEMAHTSKNTALNRYPAVFSAIAKALRWNATNINEKQQTKKILSIGCGYGAEVQTLRQLFPGSIVHGYDLDVDVIKEAQQTNEEYPEVDFFWRRQDLGKDYDLVMCLSVACRYPNSKDFKFDQFCRLMTDVDSHVSPGGFIALYNAQYDYCECEQMQNYYVAIDIGRHDSGVVPKFTPLGKPLGPEFWVPILFKKTTPAAPELFSLTGEREDTHPSLPSEEVPPHLWHPWCFETTVVVSDDDETQPPTICRKPIPATRKQ